MIKKLLWGAAVAAPALIADRLTKIWAAAARPAQELIPGVVAVHYAENTGAAFSAFSGAAWLVTGASAALILAVTALLAADNKMNRWARLGLWLVVAGGLGNLYDRLAYGYVVDFIELLFIDFAIFNVADICVCCGAVIAAAALLVQDAGGKKRTEGA